MSQQNYSNVKHTLPWVLTFALLMGLVILTLPIPDYNLELSQNHVEVRRGDQETISVFVSLMHGYREKVFLAVDTNHEDIYATLSTEQINKGGVTKLTVRVSPDSKLAKHSFFVTASSENGRRKRTEILLKIKPQV